MTAHRLIGGVAGQPLSRHDARRDRPPEPGRRARNCPATERDAGRQQRASLVQAPRPRPRRRSTSPRGFIAAIQRLRAVCGSVCGRNQVAGAPPRQRPERTLHGALGDRHGAPAPGGRLGRHQLGPHAALRQAGPHIARHRLDLGGDRSQPVEAACIGIAARIGGVEARRRRTAGPADRPGSVTATCAASRSLSPNRISSVAIGVVLVDDRHDAELQQMLHRGAGIQVAAAVGANPPASPGPGR